MTCGIRFPLGFSAGINCAFTDLTMPSGFLGLSAFSNWSIFNPMDYRFNNATVSYVELGFHGNRRIDLKSADFCPEIALSYIKVNGYCTYEHKEIIVLFPVYVNPVKKTFTNNHILLITPNLKLNSHAGKFDICGLLNQKMPVQLNAEKSSGDNIETGQNVKSNKSKYFGGTTVSIGIIRYLTI